MRTGRLLPLERTSLTESPTPCVESSDTSARAKRRRISSKDCAGWSIAATTARAWPRIDDGELLITKPAGRIDDLVQKLSEHPSPGHVGIGHTRWATHGPATDANAHPHLGGDGGRGRGPQRRDRKLPPAQEAACRARATSSTRRPTPRSSPT